MRKAKKSLSQNFIIDKNICKKILDQTVIRDNIIIEIGPGKGFLTDLILDKKPKELYLIEKDDFLYNDLLVKYKSIKNITLINIDVLKYEFNKHKNLIIISNLPYNISTKIILHLFKYSNNINQMVFMIQKEVGLKFDYNLNQMNKYKFFNKLICKYKRCFDVSSMVFIPKPKVKSTVVKFIFNNNKINYKKADMFSSKIFKNKRKKISNKIKINKSLKNNILNKRVDELSIDDLLLIYNSF